MVQNHEVKRIKFIYIAFIIFLMMVVASFALIYLYSRNSLKESLNLAASMQMEHSSLILDQKIKEIEIEADGIIHSDNLKALQLSLDSNEDVYDIVTCINDLKTYLNDRQQSNVGMAYFVIYWPESKRIVSNVAGGNIDSSLFLGLEDNSWFVKKNSVYYCKQYITDWDTDDDEPYLIIKMDSDYLYKITTMTLNLESGGTMLIAGDYRSLFSLSKNEKEIVEQLRQHSAPDKQYQVMTDVATYQIVESNRFRNKLKLISYYPFEDINKPINHMTKFFGLSLIVVIALGAGIMLQYYRHIILQMQMLTNKLKQVEEGDLSVQFTKLPNNEFSYLFSQFNSMVTRIKKLIDVTVKEQKLRSQAEMRQLQLQINPHFLYNSLSYIVTVAGNPKAVTEMAMHLANYYRYCTKNASSTTIGEEVSFAKSYLAIMAMRKRIEFFLDIDNSLEQVKIIPLVIQPIIENAIEHGIEERENAKYVQLKVYRIGQHRVQVEVSDDGEGLSEDAIEKLLEQINAKTRDDSSSVGLWNVNQRLINYYDKSASLMFGKSIWGGLRVYFSFKMEDTDEGSNR